MSVQDATVSRKQIHVFFQHTAIKSLMKLISVENETQRVQESPMVNNNKKQRVLPWISALEEWMRLRYLWIG